MPRTRAGTPLPFYLRDAQGIAVGIVRVGRRERLRRNLSWAPGVLGCGCILTLPPEESKRTPLPNPLPFGRGEGERYGSGGSIKMRPSRALFFANFLFAPLISHAL